MKKFLILCFLLLPITLMSQEGTPFITHYEGSRGRDIQNWAICQDGQGVMYFANRHGLLSYDGYRWENIRLPNSPMTVALDHKSEKLFIGAFNNFGYLEKDSKGTMVYNQVYNDSADIGVITGIHFEDDLIFFW